MLGSVPQQTFLVEGSSYRHLRLTRLDISLNLDAVPSKLSGVLCESNGLYLERELTNWCEHGHSGLRA